MEYKGLKPMSHDDIVQRGYVRVIDVEKLLLAKLGRPWTPAGISIASLIDELAERASTSASEPSPDLAHEL